jgi:hypothetical protein
MDLRHERARGVDHTQLALLRFGTHSRRNTVCAENQNRAFWHFANRFDENRAAPPQLINDVAVMHDLVMNIDRLAVGFQRQVDNVNGTHHTCAEPARTDPYESLCARLRRGRFAGLVDALNLCQRQMLLPKRFILPESTTFLLLAKWRFPPIGIGLRHLFTTGYGHF